MSPLNSSENDRDALVCSLDVAASYLKVVEEDLVDSMRETVVDLGARYENEKPENRGRFWEEIRYVIRRLDGGMSECNEFSKTFEEYARANFDSIWNALSFNEQSEIMSEYKFERFGNERINRPNFLDSRRTAWVQTRRRMERLLGNLSQTERERVFSRMADNREIVFALCEYVYAIDDHEGDFENPEVNWLLNRFMEAVREMVYPAVPQTGGSQPTDAEQKNLERIDESGTEAGGAQEADGELDAEEIEPEENDDDSDGEAYDVDEANAPHKPDGYYPIDENAAANAKRAISFDDYVPNSQTQSYRREVDDARSIAAEQKKKVDAQFHQRIDRILEKFERWLASWYDRRNAAEASYPSLLIVGPGNFSTSKHAKKVERLSALFLERDQIFALLSKIEGIGSGGVRSDDVNALEKLQKKVETLVKLHEEMKRANSYLRRKGTWEGFDNTDLVKNAYDSNGKPAFFYLSNSNQEIRRLKGRIEVLQRQAETDYGDGWRFEGGVTKVNKEANRVQIFFDETVDRATRMKLRGRGFLWSPKNRAWQRMLTPDAIWAAKFLGYIPKDWRPSKAKQEQGE